jgi:hypothetical protein
MLTLAWIDMVNDSETPSPEAERRYLEELKRINAKCHSRYLLLGVRNNNIDSQESKITLGQN